MRGQVKVPYDALWVLNVESLRLQGIKLNERRLLLFNEFLERFRLMLTCLSRIVILNKFFVILVLRTFVCFILLLMLLMTILSFFLLILLIMSI